MKKFLVKTLLIASISMFVFHLCGCGNNNQSDSKKEPISYEVTIKINDEEIESIYFPQNGEEFTPGWETIIDLTKGPQYLLPITAGEKTLTMDFISQPQKCNPAYMFTVSKSGNTSSYQEKIFGDFQADGNRQTAQFTIPETLSEDIELLFMVIYADWGTNINGKYINGNYYIRLQLI